MILTFFIIIIVGCLLYLHYRYSILKPNVKGLPILLYHKVSYKYSGLLTVSEGKLKVQFQYLKDNGYTPIFFSELIDSVNNNTTLPKKPVIITFDDGYQNNFNYLYPLLEQFSFKATIFLPVGYIGKTNEWDRKSIKLMNYDTLRLMDSKYIEYGLHSFLHKSYKRKPLDFIEEDLKKCYQTLEENNINYVKVLAYPYGSFPREKETFLKFAEMLKKSGIVYGLRIGNKVNKLPLTNPYLVKRIDIKGTYNIFEFSIKLKKGRVKLF